MSAKHVLCGLLLCLGASGWAQLSTGDKDLPTAYVDICPPKEQNVQHYFVQKADKLWYHLHAASGYVDSVGYKLVSPTGFVNGLSLVYPVDMVVDNTPVNRAQLCKPYASGEEMAHAESTWFVCLLRDDDTLFKFPISSLYVNYVLEAASGRDSATLTDAVVKRILLEATRSNRSYGIGTVLDEEQWDY